MFARVVDILQKTIGQTCYPNQPEFVCITDCVINVFRKDCNNVQRATVSFYMCWQFACLVYCDILVKHSHTHCRLRHLNGSCATTTGFLCFCIKH